MSSSPIGSAWQSFVDEQCAGIEANGGWRSPRSFDTAGSVDSSGVVEDRGTKVVAFASNDYLGLTTHPSVVAAAHEALERWGSGSGASRLVTGSRPVHHTLESELAEWKNEERSVVFPTGYAANLGVLTTFGHEEALVVSDQLNHASIIDGARLARAEVTVYAHRDVEHLELILARRGSRDAIVVTDLVFSMDGDVAPIAGIAEACRRHGALLIIDEAHSVLGPDPKEYLDSVDVLRVGTLSKALASIGGFVAGPKRFIELLENRARSYIFTTATPPPAAAAALAALRVVRSKDGTDLLRRLRHNVNAVRSGHPSPIVPVVLGSEEAALLASARLLERGYWVPAIRPPTVPPGTSRLRVTLSAAHKYKDVVGLARELDLISDRIAAG